MVNFLRGLKQKSILSLHIFASKAMPKFKYNLQLMVKLVKPIAVFA